MRGRDPLTLLEDTGKLQRGISVPKLSGNAKPEGNGSCAIPKAAVVAQAKGKAVCRGGIQTARRCLVPKRRTLGILCHAYAQAQAFGIRKLRALVPKLRKRKKASGTLGKIFYFVGSLGFLPQRLSLAMRSECNGAARRAKEGLAVGLPLITAFLTFHRFTCSLSYLYIIIIYPFVRFVKVGVLFSAFSRKKVFLLRGRGRHFAKNMLQ